MSRLRDKYLDGRAASGIKVRPSEVDGVQYVYWCSCPGCWACSGFEPYCTCDVDWDRLAEERLNQR
jgi:hypothetical protein